MNELQLNPEQMDILKEIGSIGAANSATALSQLLGKKVTINVSQVDLMAINEVPRVEFLAAGSEIGIAASSNILGSLTGGMLVLFSQTSAMMMIDILMKRQIGTTQFINIMDTSALSECSSILCCSYLNAITEFLNLYKLIPSISQMYMDTIERLMKVLLKGFTATKSSGYILPIQNNLNIEDIRVDLFVIFILDYESVKKILKTVGL